MSSFPTLVDEADSPMSAPPKHPQLHPIWGKWGEPATIIVYGDSGIGKSTDMIYSFPTALFLSLPGAMKPSISTIGISKDDLWVVEVNNLDGAINAITRAAQLPPERRPVAVVVDDLTLLAERQAMDMKNSGNYQMVGDGVFRFWGDLRNKVQTLALYTRGIGAFPCFNAHRCTPRSDKDGFWKGGPELPSKKLVKAIPHAADVVYKAEAEVSRKGQNFWTGVYRCEPEDPSYHMKDRHGYRGVVPMNLGELLRAVGYQLPRLPALQWQETVADTIVEQRAEGLAVKDVVTHWTDKLNGKVHKLHIRWALRDGLDRYTIQNMREDSIFAL